MVSKIWKASFQLCDILLSTKTDMCKTQWILVRDNTAGIVIYSVYLVILWYTNILSLESFLDDGNMTDNEYPVMMVLMLVFLFFFKPKSNIFLYNNKVGITIIAE